MIDDLDETLAALLRRELAPGLSEQIQVSFEAPLPAEKRTMSRPR